MVDRSIDRERGNKNKNEKEKEEEKENANKRKRNLMFNIVCENLDVCKKKKRRKKKQYLSKLCKHYFPLGLRLESESRKVGPREVKIKSLKERKKDSLRFLGSYFKKNNKAKTVVAIK